MSEGGKISFTIVFVSILVFCIILVFLYLMRSKKKQSNIAESPTLSTNNETLSHMRMNSSSVYSPARKNIYLKVVIVDQLTESNLHSLLEWLRDNTDKRRTIVSIISEDVVDYTTSAAVAAKDPQLLCSTVRMSDSVRLFVVSNYWYSVHKRVQLEGFTLNGDDKIALEIDTGVYVMLYSGAEPISTDSTYSSLCASINVLNIFNSTKLYWANNRLSVDTYTDTTPTSEAPNNVILNYITPNISAPVESSDILPVSNDWSYNVYVTLFKLNEVSTNNALLLRQLFTSIYQLTTKWPCLIIVSPPYYTIADMSVYLPVNVRLKRVTINSTSALTVIYREDINNPGDRVTIGTQISKEFGLIASVVVHKPLSNNTDTIPPQRDTFCQLGMVQSSPYSLTTSDSDKNIAHLLDSLSLSVQAKVDGSLRAYTPLIYTSFTPSDEYPSKFTIPISHTEDSMLIVNDSNVSHNTRLFNTIDPFNTLQGITIY